MPHPQSTIQISDILRLRNHRMNTGFFVCAKLWNSIWGLTLLCVDSESTLNDYLARVSFMRKTNHTKHMSCQINKHNSSPVKQAYNIGFHLFLADLVNTLYRSTSYKRRAALVIVIEAPNGHRCEVGTRLGSFIFANMRLPNLVPNSRRSNTTL